MSPYMILKDYYIVIRKYKLKQVKNQVQGKWTKESSRPQSTSVYLDEI